MAAGRAACNASSVCVAIANLPGFRVRKPRPPIARIELNSLVSAYMSARSASPQSAGDDGITRHDSVAAEVAKHSMQRVQERQVLSSCLRDYDAALAEIEGHVREALEECEAVLKALPCHIVVTPGIVWHAKASTTPAVCIPPDDGVGDVYTPGSTTNALPAAVYNLSLTQLRAGLWQVRDRTRRVTQMLGHLLIAQCLVGLGALLDEAHPTAPPVSACCRSHMRLVVDAASTGRATLLTLLQRVVNASGVVTRVSAPDHTESDANTAPGTDVDPALAFYTEQGRTLDVALCDIGEVLDTAAAEVATLHSLACRLTAATRGGDSSGSSEPVHLGTAWKELGDRLQQWTNGWVQQSSTILAKQLEICARASQQVQAPPDDAVQAAARRAHDAAGRLRALAHAREGAQRRHLAAARAASAEHAGAAGEHTTRQEFVGESEARAAPAVGEGLDRASVTEVFTVASEPTPAAPAPDPGPCDGGHISDDDRVPAVDTSAMLGELAAMLAKRRQTEASGDVRHRHVVLGGDEPEVAPDDDSGAGVATLDVVGELAQVLRRRRNAQQHA